MINLELWEGPREEEDKLRLMIASQRSEIDWAHACELEAKFNASHADCLRMQAESRLEDANKRIADLEKIIQLEQLKRSKG